MRSFWSNRLSRRELLKASALGFFTASASGWPELLAAGAAAAKVRPRSCIVLWTDGGLSQVDSLDMKPDAPAQVRGEFKPMATTVPGIQVCEHLPKLAQQMRDLVILRSLYTSEGAPAHPPARILLHSDGLGEGVRGRRPCLGAALSACLATPDLALPSHLVLGKQPGVYSSDPFGAKHGPVVLQDGSLDSLLAMTRPAVEARTFGQRYQLLREVDQGFAQDRRDPLLEARAATYERAVDLMRSPELGKVDPEKVPVPVREAFGTNRVGRGCLLASLLVEAGVPFVEVNWNVNTRVGPESDNTTQAWDTHEDNFRVLKHYLPVMDAALSALLTRLKERGLLESTLIVCMGEMGRTPKVNRKTGRDHFGRAWSVLLAGAGLKAGQAFGSTSPDGNEVKERPIKTPDLMATLCKAVGLDPATEFNGRTGQWLDPNDKVMTAGAVRLVGKSANPVQEVLC